MPSPSLGLALEQAKDAHQLAIRQGRDADAVSALRAAVLTANVAYVNGLNEAEGNVGATGRRIAGWPTDVVFAASDAGAGWSGLVGI